MEIKIVQNKSKARPYSVRIELERDYDYEAIFGEPDPSNFTYVNFRTKEAAENYLKKFDKR